MSDAAATADLLPQSRSGRLLTLVRKLWDYGLQISASLRQDPPATDDDKAHLTRTFGVSNVMLILTRIALGLKRARFLERKITRAAAQIDAGSQPEPAPPRRARRTNSSPTPRAPSPYRAPPPDDETVALLVRLPTIGQIARKVLREPIGRALADICHDLGISEGHPLWDEIHAVITEFGGSVVAKVKTAFKQSSPLPRIEERLKTEPESPPEPDSTGPPLPAAA
jgi:hypothetical protein